MLITSSDCLMRSDQRLNVMLHRTRTDSSPLMVTAGRDLSPVVTSRAMMSVMAGSDTVSLDEDILGTAAEHASVNVPIAAPTDSVDQVVAVMRGRRFDSAALIAVCDADHLVGVVTIERLLAADGGSLVGELTDPDTPTVAPHVNQEHAAWIAVRHDELGLAVTDDTGRFRGLISPQRILTVLLSEHDQDLARIGGFLGTAASARAASVEPVATPTTAPWASTIATAGPIPDVPSSTTDPAAPSCTNADFTAT